MLTETIERLAFLCDTIPALLKEIPEEQFSHKPAPDKWSKKEVIGHLIDSATNNHQRFVRVQFEDSPFIVYDQDKWNASGYYQNMDSAHVINFWKEYNLHLLELIKRIPSDKLSRECRSEAIHTLQWLIEDYVVHMEHHLRDILSY